MKPELQDSLFAKYPAIFRQRTLPCSQTCLCFGLEVPDSWYFILDQLCFNIEMEVAVRGLKPIEAVQVKEKFGSLRFYTNYYDEKIEEYIQEAEKLTTEICAYCGSRFDVKPTSGWIDYLCKFCRDQNNRKAYNEEEDV